MCLDGLQQQLVDCLAAGSKSADVIAAEIQVPFENLITSLVSLEIMGLVYSQGGTYFLSVASATGE